MRVVTDYNSFESLLLGPRLGLEFLVAPGYEVGSTRRVEQCRNRGYMRQNVLGLMTRWHQIRPVLLAAGLATMQQQISTTNLAANAHRSVTIRELAMMLAL